MGRPIETNRGNSTIGNSHCVVAGDCARLPGAANSQTYRVCLRPCRVEPADVARAGPRTPSNADSSERSRATRYWYSICITSSMKKQYSFLS